MIYYPLSSLMLAGIREVLVISTPEDLPAFQRLLGDGARVGLELSYAVQPRPEGLAQAFLIGRDFVGGDRVALALGDNVFYGHGFPEVLRRGRGAQRAAPPSSATGCTIPSATASSSSTPQGRALAHRGEAGAAAQSHWAVTGLYFYDNRVLDIAKPRWSRRRAASSRSPT